MRRIGIREELPSIKEIASFLDWLNGDQDSSPQTFDAMTLTYD